MAATDDNPQRNREHQATHPKMLDNKLSPNRILFAAGFICLPLMYLLYQAFTSSEIEFLRPALRGKWITHPNPPISFQQSSTCPDVIFYRDFQLETPPEKEKVQITAMRGFSIKINNKIKGE